jgi:cytochrome c-type biogenesis protein CcsB
MSATPEIVIVWAAIAAYALASVAFTAGVLLGKEGLERAGVVIAAAGLAVHGAAIGLRWVRVGHGPYLGFYEVASLLAFMAVGGFLLLVTRHRSLAIAGVALLPMAFLVLGGTLLVNNEAQALTGSLKSLWLVIHVMFANVAFAAYAASFVLAVAFLMKDGALQRRWEVLLDRFPGQDVLDALTFRAIGAGFVFQTMMIASGSIWANQAWGRYWGWDPMETWSLVAWAVYAVYLHVTLTLGWRARRAAWIAVAALPVILFSLLGVPVLYHSIHAAYLTT